MPEPEYVHIRIGSGHKVHLARKKEDLVMPLCSVVLVLGSGASIAINNVEGALCKSCLREYQKWQCYRKVNA